MTPRQPFHFVDATKKPCVGVALFNVTVRLVYAISENEFTAAVDNPVVTIAFDIS